MCVNLVVLRKFCKKLCWVPGKIHSWHKFYTTAGHDGRDKSQLWRHHYLVGPNNGYHHKRQIIIYSPKIMFINKNVLIIWLSHIIAIIFITNVIIIYIFVINNSYHHTYHNYHHFLSIFYTFLQNGSVTIADTA